MAIRIANHVLPFMRVGGHSVYALPTLVKCQTDASYRKDGAWIASLIHRPDGTRCESIKRTYTAVDSTEAEWASVLLGLTKCMEENYYVIGIENDNIGVISHLIFKDRMPNRDYAKYYRSKIYDLSRQTEWTGVRWIQREFKLADRILRRPV